MKQPVGALAALLAGALLASTPLARAQAPIPPSITTPDRVDSRIGVLDFRDGEISAFSFEVRSGVVGSNVLRGMTLPTERLLVYDIGANRLLFATDYPHWDFDDPFRAFPASVPREHATAILSQNARRVFRLS